MASICLSKFIDEPLILKNKDNLEITIYTKENCGYCKLAKMLCTQHKFKTHLFNEFTNEQQKKEFEEKYNTKVETYPQIVIKQNDEVKHIGGYQEFEDLLRPRIILKNYMKLQKLSHEI